VKIFALRWTIAGAIAVAGLSGVVEAQPLGPTQIGPRISTIRIDLMRPGAVPGAPRIVGAPKEEYMLAPAQPDAPRLQKKKRRN
jgi:hypothetical protein